MEYLKDIESIEVIVGVITSIFVWFFTKRHFQQRALELKDSEVESASLDVIEKKLKFYERMLDDLDKRYLGQIEALQVQGEEKSKLIKELRERIEVLEKRDCKE